MDAPEAHESARERPRGDHAERFAPLFAVGARKLGLVLLDQQVISKKRERSAAWHSFSPSE
jgi:hypothetical protein